MIQTFFPRSSQVTNNGAIVKTLKWSNKQAFEDAKFILPPQKFVKTVLICFFDMREAIHSEFVPQGQTVNQAFCKPFATVCGGRGLIYAVEWLVFHHDKAPAHTAVNFCTSNSTSVLPPPPIFTRLYPMQLFFISLNEKRHY